MDDYQAALINAGLKKRGPGAPKTSRNANRHRPGYFTDYMRKRRAAAKEGK